jgi:hypothetical protein
MSLCQYCNTKAGLFRSEHPECAARAETGLRELREMTEKAVLEDEAASKVIPRMTALVEQCRIPSGVANQAAISALDKATGEKARKIMLSQDEFDNIYALYSHYKYNFVDPDNAVKKRFGFAYAGLSNVLWHVRQGSPLPYDGDGRAYFNLAVGEKPIFCFGGTTFAEEKTVTNRGYAGVSVPIGDGIRINTGSLGSRSVTGLAPIDQGDFLMTNQAIYFGGQHKTLHIPYRTILRFKPYIDGVGVFQNAGREKVFIQELHGGESGWFINAMIESLVEGCVK